MQIVVSTTGAYDTVDWGAPSGCTCGESGDRERLAPPIKPENAAEPGGGFEYVPAEPVRYGADAEFQVRPVPRPEVTATANAIVTRVWCIKLTLQRRTNASSRSMTSIQLC